MFEKIKFRLLSSLADLALKVGLLGVEPASVILWYQPEVPAHLKDDY